MSTTPNRYVAKIPTSLTAIATMGSTTAAQGKVILANRTGSGGTTGIVSLKVYEALGGIEYFLIKNIIMAPGITAEIPIPICLKPNDIIKAICDQANTVDIFLSTFEYVGSISSNIKNFGANDLASSLTDAYVCPTGKVAQAYVFMTNTGSGTILGTVAFVDIGTSTTYYAYRDYPIDPNASEVSTIPIHMIAGDKIRWSCDTASSSSFFISIIEADVGA